MVNIPKIISSLSLVSAIASGVWIIDSRFVTKQELRDVQVETVVSELNHLAIKGTDQTEYDKIRIVMLERQLVLIKEK